MSLKRRCLFIKIPSVWLMIFPVIFCIWSVQYQYLCVVNLSRRQTLIKIFTKYLPTANRNISAIFTKQNPRVSSPTLCNLASIPGQFEIDYIGYLLPGKPHSPANIIGIVEWYYTVYTSTTKRSITRWISCWIPIRFKSFQ